MDDNSIADAMRDIHDDPDQLPQTYTPGPIELSAQVEQLRENNFVLIDENRSLRQLIQTLKDESTQLKDQLIQAKDQMIRSLLDRQVANPAAPVLPTPVSGTSTTSKVKTRDPDAWSGTRSTLPRFLASCRAKFLVEKHNFPDEFTKIGYAGSFLKDTPQDWWLTLFQRYEESLGRGDAPPKEFNSFTEFAHALTTTYGDPDLVNTMERKLRMLRQTTSVAAYAAEFQRIAGYLTAAGWTDRPLLSNFKAGLKEVIKAVLVHEKPYPTTLHEMTAAAIRIDNSEYEMSQDRKTSTQTTKTSSNQYRSRHTEPTPQLAAPPSTTALNPPVTQNTAWGNPRASSGGPPLTSSDGTTPMELDFVGKIRPPLTNAQKEYRRTNKLCLYCGEPNHSHSDCPKAEIAAKYRTTTSGGNNRRINFITEIPDSPDTMESTNAHAQE